MTFTGPFTYAGPSPLPPAQSTSLAIGTQPEQFGSHCAEIVDVSVLFRFRLFATFEVFDVPELQAWTIPDARITTAAASLSLNQLKHRLFTAYSSVEKVGRIKLERSVELSSGSGQRLSLGNRFELRGAGLW
jgi:hypothetical protein